MQSTGLKCLYLYHCYNSQGLQQANDNDNDNDNETYVISALTKLQIYVYNIYYLFIYFILFIQHFYSALFINKYALMRIRNRTNKQRVNDPETSWRYEAFLIVIFIIWNI